MQPGNVRDLTPHKAPVGIHNATLVILRNTTSRVMGIMGDIRRHDDTGVPQVVKGVVESKVE